LLTGQGEQAITPAFGRVFKALLGGELDGLAEGFEVTAKELKTSWHIHLTPKDKLLNKVISTIKVTGDTELRFLEVQEVNGNLTQIHFSGITHPGQLSLEDQTDFERLSP
jgi:Outer membrane lipoprotein carrier protein LolA-like